MGKKAVCLIRRPCIKPYTNEGPSISWNPPIRQSLIRKRRKTPASPSVIVVRRSIQSSFRQRIYWRPYNLRPYLPTGSCHICINNDCCACVCMCVSTHRSPCLLSLFYRRLNRNKLSDLTDSLFANTPQLTRLWVWAWGNVVDKLIDCVQGTSWAVVGPWREAGGQSSFLKHLKFVWLISSCKSITIVNCCLPTPLPQRRTILAEVDAASDLQ